MQETFVRHGVTVTISRREPGTPSDIPEAEHRGQSAQQDRRVIFGTLDYKGYPGLFGIWPYKDGLWEVYVSYGYTISVAESVAAPSACRSVDDAIDAAVKLYIEGRKLARGKTSRDVSAMQAAQMEREKRKRRR
jgi:hypothetical protein